METAAFLALLLFLLILVLLPLLARVKWKNRLTMRYLGAFRQLPAKVGLAAESGRPLHISLGSGSLSGVNAAASLAALEVLDALSGSIAAYDTPPIVTVGDPTVMVLAQDILRRAYARRGTPQRYNPNYVEFLSPVPIGYAAAAGEIVRSENAIANIVVGSFGEEVTLLTDSGTHDVDQLAAAAAPQALGALYPAVGTLAAGEELFAGKASITGAALPLAGLRMQDLVRVLLAVSILVLALLSGAGIFGG